MKPWNPAILIDGLTRQVQLQWGHGGEAVESDTAPLAICRAALLQWGHGGEAVESEAGLARLVSQGLASMGPRR